MVAIQAKVHFTGPALGQDDEPDGAVRAFHVL